MNITIHHGAFRKRKANWKITIVLSILPRRQIIIKIITTTINPPDFRNQNIRFPTNHCERCTVCNANIIVFHNITQSPRDNTHDFVSAIVFFDESTCSCIRFCRCTSFPGNTPSEAGRLFIVASDWLPLAEAVVVVRPESRIYYFIHKTDRIN